MKRSDALGIIMDEMIHYAQYKDDLNALDMARLILDQLEEAGMQPPQYTNPPWKNYIGIGWEKE